MLCPTHPRKIGQTPALDRQMNRHSSYIAMRPATPEYVLAVIRGAYRQQLQFDPEAEPGIALDFDSTIAEWRNACDLVAWKALGRALSIEWQFAATDQEWKQVLEPAKKAALGKMCGFIASRACQPEILPSRLLGGICAKGGTFLAIREILGNADADVHTIRPSSPIEPYLRQYPGVFLDALSRLAPNRLPPIKLHDRLRTYVLLAFIGGLVAASILSHFNLFPLLAASVLLALLALAYLVFGPPARAEFPGIVTFRDLVEQMPDGDTARQS